MRATTGAPRDAIHLQSQLRGDVLDVLGGQTTLLRFFATPHDLRRMNDLKQLQPFVHFLRRTLVGEYDYKSYIDGGTAILMQQQAAVSMRNSAGSELADDNGIALDILLGTGPDMTRGPYAAYEWANCMYGAHSSQSSHMQLAVRDEAPPAPAQSPRVCSSPCTTRRHQRPRARALPCTVPLRARLSWPCSRRRHRLRGHRRPALRLMLA